MALWCDNARRENETETWSAERFNLTTETGRKNDLIDTQDSILPNLAKRPGRKELRNCFWVENDQPLQLTEFCSTNKKFQENVANGRETIDIHKFSPLDYLSETKTDTTTTTTTNKSESNNENENENESEKDGNEDIIAAKENESENIDLGDLSNVSDEDVNKVSNEIDKYINKHLQFYDDRLNEIHSKAPKWDEKMTSLNYENSQQKPHITFDYIVYDDNGIVYPNIHAMGEFSQNQAKQWGGDLFSKYFDDDLQQRQENQQSSNVQEKHSTTEAGLKPA